MYAITKDIINEGILNNKIQFDYEYKGKVLIFLDENEKLDKIFFDRMFKIECDYGCNISYNYSIENNCIIIVVE